jgi:uncharacterized membrane-anchored protein YjiN (DUF445 family)
VSKTAKKTKTSTKTTNMKKASKKTSSSTTTNRSRKTSTASQTSKKKVVQQVTVTKKVTTKYTKGSKKKKVTTKTVTETKLTTYKAKTMTSVQYENGDQPSVDKIAPLADESVRDAFKELGMKILIKTDASYTGYTNMQEGMIILKKADDVVYHELGHFLSYIGGNYCTTEKFKIIYEEERMKYNQFNASYVRSTSYEYFAESYKDYLLDEDNLKATRPKTYEAIEECLSMVTPDTIAKQKYYLSLVWAK